jgi:hypothetical protein
MKWTPKDIEFLKNNFSKLDNKTLAKRLKRTYTAIKNKALVLGIRKGNYYDWNNEAIERLTALFPMTSNKELAVIFNCKLSTVESKAYYLGLKKDEKHLAKMGETLLQSGKNSRFNKGNISHNTGKKMEEFMSREQIEKVKASQFKKGIIPHNALIAGTLVEREDKNGTIYTFIKVEGKRTLELYQRYVWEQNFGPIPKGHIIRFKNGNTKDFSPENLLCLSKKDNMKMNSIHQYPIELKNLMRTNGRLKNQIKKLK